MNNNDNNIGWFNYLLSRVCIALLFFVLWMIFDLCVTAAVHYLIVRFIIYFFNVFTNNNNGGRNEQQHQQHQQRQQRQQQQQRRQQQQQQQQRQRQQQQQQQQQQAARRHSTFRLREAAAATGTPIRHSQTSFPPQQQQNVSPTGTSGRFSTETVPHFVE